MKLKDYLKEQFFNIILVLFFEVFFVLCFRLFKVNSELIWVYIFFSIALFFIILIRNFYRQKKFYESFFQSFSQLDQKYLIHEIIHEPDILQGKILMNILYELDKSMKEHLNDYQSQVKDFKEYVEMWIHEVKIPLANLILLVHNGKLKQAEMQSELERLENYLDQILYYVRSENSEKDYLIQKNNLKKMIGQVIQKNKERFILESISLELNDLDYEVLTDSKWFLFFLNQILNNSLKYRKKENAKIKIYGEKIDNKVILHIWDNGIGIPKKDLGNVFQKSFTGINGRKRSTSTGMGLYITKNLCNKLGHLLEIKSEENEFTEVIIVFQNDSYYEVIKR